MTPDNGPYSFETFEKRAPGTLGTPGDLNQKESENHQPDGSLKTTALFPPPPLPSPEMRLPPLFYSKSSSSNSIVNIAAYSPATIHKDEFIVIVIVISKTFKVLL